MNKCCLCDDYTFAGRYCIGCLESRKLESIDDLAASIAVYANAIAKENKKAASNLDDVMKEIVNNGNNN